MSIDTIRAAVRNILDFPAPGIIFKDITPILSNAAIFNEAVDLMCERWRDNPPDHIAAIDARGFFFAGAMSLKLGVGIIPIRKTGKLPYQTLTQCYELEYGESEIQVHIDALRPGDRVLVVDDVLATGGTAAAAVELIRKLKGEVIGVQFLLELGVLNGAEKLKDVPFFTLIRD